LRAIGSGQANGERFASSVFSRIPPECFQELADLATEEQIGPDRAGICNLFATELSPKLRKL
jgi:hypothetical protein